MNKEQMQQDLEEMIARHIPTATGAQLLKAAQAILDAGFVKVPYDVEGDEEYCLEVISLQSGEPVKRDDYWGTLEDAKRDLKFSLEYNRKNLEQGRNISFKYGIVKRTKSVLYSEIEVVDEVRELP